MTRTRRTFTAAFAAAVVTAATMGAVSTSSAAGCEYKIWKIVKREQVTCRKAKKVLKHDPYISGGDETALPGWKCTYGTGLIPEGKCHKKGTEKSFKYKQK